MEEQSIIGALLQSFEPTVKRWIKDVLTENSTQKEDVLLSLKEAADLLGLQTGTMYQKVNKKELPYRKRGNRLYFSKAELLEHIEAGRIGTRLEDESAIDEKLKMMSK